MSSDPDRDGALLATLRVTLEELRATTTPHIHRRAEVAERWAYVDRTLEELERENGLRKRH